jgi:hypothetical protein
MNNEDKMLQLVLSDTNLSSYYEFKAEEYPTIKDALQADNPVVVAVAKIIKDIGENSKNEVYKELFNYLNRNIL